jgi:hypothetical protein
MNDGARLSSFYDTICQRLSSATFAIPSDQESCSALDAPESGRSFIGLTNV